MALERCLGECSFCKAKASAQRRLAGRTGRPERICVSCATDPIPDLPGPPVIAARAAYATGESRDAERNPRPPPSGSELSRAARALEATLRSDPSDVRSRLKLGDVYAALGRTRAAVVQYRHAALSYAADGFFLKAVAVSKQILKLDGEDAETYGALAALYERLGLLSDAATMRTAAAHARPHVEPATSAWICDFCDRGGSDGTQVMKSDVATICVDCLAEARRVLGD